MPANSDWRGVLRIERRFSADPMDIAKETESNDSSRPEFWDVRYASGEKRHGTFTACLRR